DIRVAAPTLTRVPKAAITFMIGIVMAKPEIASGPTPWPIKILSIMLCNDEDNIAMIDGIAYLNNNLGIFSVPNTKGALSCFIIASSFFFLLSLIGAKFRIKRQSAKNKKHHPKPLP